MPAEVGLFDDIVFWQNLLKNPKLIWSVLNNYALEKTKPNKTN